MDDTDLVNFVRSNAPRLLLAAQAVRQTDPELLAELCEAMGLDLDAVRAEAAQALARRREELS